MRSPPFGPGRTRPFDPMIRDVTQHRRAEPVRIIRHHLNPERALSGWTRDMAALPAVPWLRDIDFVVWEDTRELARQAMARDITPVDLDQSQIGDLVAFMRALTGRTAKQTLFGVPDSVPSGLPVD